MSRAALGRTGRDGAGAGKPAPPFGFSLAANGKTSDNSPLMLQQKLEGRPGVWLSPHVFGPMKPVDIPSLYSVRAAIAAPLYHGDAALQRTARQLGMSPRSLQRHLAEMGTSYSDMVAEVRVDAACHLLLESNERISQIALRLGYAGASSFSRVFMRLTRMQPVTYRRQRAVQEGEKSRSGKEPQVANQHKRSQSARSGKAASLPIGSCIRASRKSKS